MTAIFSPKRDYRYRLEREIQPEGIIASIIMVNGSDADEEKNDHTVTKLFGFGRALGWRRIIVGNLFGAIGKDIKVLRGHRDPIGPDNDKHLEQIMDDGEVLVVGWGSKDKLPAILRKRWVDIVRMADRKGKTMHCLGINDDCHPKHPLMTGYDVPLTEWCVPWFPNRVLPPRYDARNYPL